MRREVKCLPPPPVIRTPGEMLLYDDGYGPPTPAAKTHSAPRPTMRGQLPMTKVRSGKKSWGKHFIRIIIVRKKEK